MRAVRRFWGRCRRSVRVRGWRGVFLGYLVWLSTSFRSPRVYSPLPAWAFVLNTANKVVFVDSLGNPPQGGPSCPSLGAGTSSTSPALLTSSAPFTPSSSNATYDTWLKQATPIILTAWLKNGSGPEAWADTRVVCLSPGNVVAGSRVPSAARRSISGAMGIAIWGLVGAVITWGML